MVDRRAHGTLKGLVATLRPLRRAGPPFVGFDLGEHNTTEAAPCVAASTRGNRCCRTRFVSYLRILIPCPVLDPNRRAYESEGLADLIFQESLV